MLEASREVQRSQRLRILLEVVLAFGNYMNRGARGNASGENLAIQYKMNNNYIDLARTKSGASVYVRMPNRRSNKRNFMIFHWNNSTGCPR